MDLKERLAELLELAKNKVFRCRRILNDRFNAWYIKYLNDNGIETPVRCRDCRFCEACNIKKAGGFDDEGFCSKGVAQEG